MQLVNGSKQQQQHWYRLVELSQVANSYSHRTVAAANNNEDDDEEFAALTPLLFVKPAGCLLPLTFSLSLSFLLSFYLRLPIFNGGSDRWGIGAHTAANEFVRFLSLLFNTLNILHRTHKDRCSLSLLLLRAFSPNLDQPFLAILSCARTHYKAKCSTITPLTVCLLCLYFEIRAKKVQRCFWLRF